MSTRLGRPVSASWNSSASATLALCGANKPHVNGQLHCKGEEHRCGPITAPGWRSAARSGALQTPRTSAQSQHHARFPSLIVTSLLSSCVCRSSRSPLWFAAPPSPSAPRWCPPCPTAQPPRSMLSFESAHPASRDADHASASLAGNTAVSNSRPWPDRTWQPPSSRGSILVTAVVLNLSPPGTSTMGSDVMTMLPSGCVSACDCSRTRSASIPRVLLTIAGALKGVTKQTRRVPCTQGPTSAWGSLFSFAWYSRQVLASR